MSYSTIIYIYPKRKIEDGLELRNSHGSAPVVWNELAQKYLGARPYAYFSVMDTLWPLYKDPAIPIAHRAVLMMTFDTAYVAKKDYARAAQDIRVFLRDFPIKEGYVNHWPTIAALYESSPRVPAIGIYHTSVTENPYMKHDHEKDRYSVRWKDMYSIYDTLNEMVGQ